MRIVAPPGNSPAANETRSEAIIVVDLQRGFLHGRILGIAHGESIIPILNHCIDAVYQQGLPIFATRDWHSADHCSFRAAGGPWPPHCIAGTAVGLLVSPPSLTDIQRFCRQDATALPGTYIA